MTTGSNGEELAVINVVMQGFATGTLLYVIFFEILSKDRSGMIPYLSVLSGVVLMAGMQYIGKHLSFIHIKNHFTANNFNDSSLLITLFTISLSQRRNL